MHKDAKILVVGHGGAIEKSLVIHLRESGHKNVVSSTEIALNTTIQRSVYQFFSDEKPEYVFLGSVCSGGIAANQENPGDFFYQNSESQNNIVYAAHKFTTKKLLYLAGSCVYPKDCPQPIKSEYLCTGPMESTSQAYSTAKLAGIELCCAYRKQYGLDSIVVIPATVYGPECDVGLSTAHVLGALIHKFYKAKENQEKSITIWGTGVPRREFIFSRDFAKACIFLMERYNGTETVHVGVGEDIAIKDLVVLLKEISGFEGEINFDTSKPDGAQQKLLDNTVITRLGFQPQVRLRQGVEETYQWYKNTMERE